MAKSMGERELLMRCRCLQARITRGEDDSLENAACCLDEAESLVRELGEAGVSFLSRPDISSDIRTSAEILSESGRPDELKRFPGLDAAGDDGGDGEG
jgi:hypothetical protein